MATTVFYPIPSHLDTGPQITEKMATTVFNPIPSHLDTGPQITKKMATTVFNPIPSHLDICPPKYGKGSVADEVLCAMGIPMVIVEMARAFQRQKHGTDTEDTVQLFTLAEELLSNPQKQYEIGQMMSKSESAAVLEVQEEKMKTHKDSCAKQVQEDGAVVNGKAALGDSAEMQEKALSKADARPAVDDKIQLKEKVQRLARENHMLKQRKMCCKCKEVDLATSGVTFLPCGHFITCETCSEAYEDCPACGKNIMGTVRTFLS